MRAKKGKKKKERSNQITKRIVPTHPIEALPEELNAEELRSLPLGTSVTVDEHLREGIWSHAGIIAHSNLEVVLIAAWDSFARNAKEFVLDVSTGAEGGGTVYLENRKVKVRVSTDRTRSSCIKHIKEDLIKVGREFGMQVSVPEHSDLTRHICDFCSGPVVFNWKSRKGGDYCSNTCYQAHKERKFKTMAEEKSKTKKKAMSTGAKSSGKKDLSKTSGTKRASGEKKEKKDPHTGQELPTDGKMVERVHIFTGKKSAPNGGTVVVVMKPEGKRKNGKWIDDMENRNVSLEQCQARAAQLAKKYGCEVTGRGSAA